MMPCDFSHLQELTEMLFHKALICPFDWAAGGGCQIRLPLVHQHPGQHLGGAPPHHSVRMLIDSNKKSDTVKAVSKHKKAALPTDNQAMKFSDCRVERAASLSCKALRYLGSFSLTIQHVEGWLRHLAASNQN